MMRVEFDKQRDRARFVIGGEGRQSHEGGVTHAIYVSPEGADPTHEPGVLVQVGFEAPCALRWISVEPASLALPREILDAAEPPQ